MKLLGILGLIAGLIAAMALVVYEGAGSIWHSASLLGVHGFAIIVAYRLGLIALMGAAWYMLGRHRADARFGRFVWGRLIRDSASEALPLSQVGGFVFGARALTVAGVNGGFAAASTVVDVTAELVAQLAYTAFGLVLLQILHPGTGFAVPLLAGIIVMAVLVVCFVAVQARSFGVVERLAARLARHFLGAGGGQAGGVQSLITDLHRRHLALLLCTLCHLVSWVASGLETWLALRLMGLGVSVPAALTIDSLLYGLRSVAFFVPNALGVQEGGMILLCGLFGIAAAPALALALIKRARDLVIGIPALLAWQALEGRRALARRAGETQARETLPAGLSGDRAGR